MCVPTLCMYITTFIMFAAMVYVYEWEIYDMPGCVCVITARSFVYVCTCIYVYTLYIPVATWSREYIHVHDSMITGVSKVRCITACFEHFVYAQCFP